MMLSVPSDSFRTLVLPSIGSEYLLNQHQLEWPEMALVVGSLTQQAER